MSSGNVFERLFKLWGSVCKLVMDGKRSAQQVCDILQNIIEEKTTNDWLADWQKFYNDVFGLELDFSEVRIPEKKDGFDRLIVVACGMTPQRLFDKCQEMFPSLKYTDKNLDEFIKSDRTVQNGHYAIWVRDRIEADEENRNLSANDLKERGGDEETLEERELHELKFFKETGRHLDLQNWTLCTGSRNSFGSVPCANCNDGKFKVNWNNPRNHNDNLRSRSKFPKTTKGASRPLLR